MSARSPSPPTSPRISTSRLSLYNISQALIRMKRLKNVKQIESTSGSDPITQLSGPVSTVQVPIRRNDEFVCAFGVDLLKLIRACRSTLFEQAKTIGANVLIDEQYVSAWLPFRIFLHRHFPQVERLHHLPKEPRRPIQGPGQISESNIFSSCFSNPRPGPIFCESHLVRYRE